MILILLILTVGVSIFVPGATLIAGALTLFAAFIGMLIIRGVQLAISLVLVATGLAALTAGLLIGDRPGLAELLMVNQDLIAMLAAVSFIQLIAGSTEAIAPRLSGAKAVWRTAAAVHVLGAVINVSALNIIGERLSREGRLSRVNELLLSRAFSAGAFWSPFWGATAAAIAISPGAKANVLIFCGLCLAVLALTYSITALVRRFRFQIGDYHGYVLTWRALRIPLVLVALVLGLHALMPDTPITRLVLVSSLGMTVITLFVTRPRTAASQLFYHARVGLPRMAGELTLFASAGVLAIGLGSFFSAVDLQLPVTEFSVPVAWFATLTMALLSLVGVHPVISMAAVAAVIAPLNPDPTLYAMAGMIAWGGSAAAGPISGLNIFLSGRFGANNFAIARTNLLYMVVVLALAWPILWLCNVLA